MTAEAVQTDAAPAAREWRPTASARTHVLLAALTWTIVGGILLFFGVRWSLAGHLQYGGLLLALALAAGLAKAWFALRPATERILRRIRARGDGRFVLSFFSGRAWLIIAAVSVTGRLVRGNIPRDTPGRAILGLVYAWVGIALLTAAALWLWRAWLRFPPLSAGARRSE